jgi:exodeoxyribonuclease VII small subunit
MSGQRDDGDVVSFEEAYDELEGIVDRLERGDLKLSEALAQYERGVGMLKRCRKILEGAERRLELLVQQADGELVTEEVDLAELRGEARGEAVVGGAKAKPKARKGGRSKPAAAKETDAGPTLFGGLGG